MQFVFVWKKEELRGRGEARRRRWLAAEFADGCCLLFFLHLCFFWGGRRPVRLFACGAFSVHFEGCGDPWRLWIGAGVVLGG